jgi:hypothetical protein
MANVVYSCSNISTRKCLISKCHTKLQAIPVVGPGFIKGDAINSPGDVILETRVRLKIS